MDISLGIGHWDVAGTPMSVADAGVDDDSCLLSFSIPQNQL